METIIWKRESYANIYIETTLCKADKLAEQIEKFEKSRDEVMIFYKGGNKRG